MSHSGQKGPAVRKIKMRIKIRKRSKSKRGLGQHATQKSSLLLFILRSLLFRTSILILLLLWSAIVHNRYSTRQSTTTRLKLGRPPRSNAFNGSQREQLTSISRKARRPVQCTAKVRLGRPWPARRRASPGNIPRQEATAATVRP